MRDKKSDRRRRLLREEIERDVARYDSECKDGTWRKMTEEEMEESRTSKRIRQYQPFQLKYIKEGKHDKR